ncbi:MAG: hypothetical protein ACSHX6_05210 [Akkermansiaceae bacterium]
MKPKTPIIFATIILIFLSSILAYADKSGPFSIGIYNTRIPNTTLIAQSTYQQNMKTKDRTHNCVVGYERDKEDGTVFIPIIGLPQLTNDTYVIKCEKGVLKVTTTKDAKFIMSIDISSIAPTLINEDFDEARQIKESRQNWNKN